jgi:hypothetical protein
MSAERITRREMLKRLIVAPVGAAALATLPVREASAAALQPHYVRCNPTTSHTSSLCCGRGARAAIACGGA